MKKNSRFHLNPADWGILYAMIILWLLMAIASPNFRSLTAYINIIREASFTAICGIGMTFAIISGDFDLSVASQIALGSVCLTLLLPVAGMAATIVIILALGALMGLFNGVLIAKMRIPAFIVTLAMMYGYRAIAQMVNEIPVVVDRDSLFKKMATSYLFGIPIPFVVMVVLAILGTVLLRKTRLGRNILAIGNSKEAAKIAGINIPNTQIAIFVLVGVFTAATSIMVTSYNGSSNYGMSEGFEFTVISAVVLGGTALVGGKGSIFTTTIASVFLATVTSGMNAFKINSYNQRVVEGIILIFAFSITGIRAILNDTMIKSRSRKALDARRKAASDAAPTPVANGSDGP